MKVDDRKILSEMIGVKPIRIKADLYSPALRDRYYWTNLDFDTKNVVALNLQDILVDGYTNRKKAASLLASDGRILSTPVKMFHRYFSQGFTTLIFKSEQHYKDCVEEYKNIAELKGIKREDFTTRCLKASDLEDYTGHVFDGVRYMYREELEVCQGVPKNYTKILTRNNAANVIGDGLNIYVILRFFKNIEKEK